ncbi:MAG TPA: serine/threonine-protein kinase, partial [Verrucomicrobiae bacterium]|nr:serine/threonine-protein kinase [Verrucomicrobiae bacterium]
MPLSPEREAALFAMALEKPVAERAVFLQAVCGSDGVLRQRLETLLAAHDQPDEALGEGANSKRTIKAAMKLEFAKEPADEAVGQTLGRYKLLERVGEGGCGVVYVAEQIEPVRRRVALKVIKLGMDTKQVVARFEAERQALAMMDHPNIAKVLDAGTTETGRPFFVMELVRGIRITDYCDQNNLSTGERLDLFIKVCHAIQHAHQKGIIHRDIKPSNILVTLHDGVPVPKVIDFGIAKATEGRLTDATVYTQLHQFIGTPAYISPEQAEMSGLDIDTRGDIYSLGVLLYELLAGSTPFDPKELIASGIDGMRKTIREKEPVRPSTRLATLQGVELTTAAKRRSTDAPKLVHQLKGDLDWIIMKCLEKDRTRRYDTATGLAIDLKRYLSNEPVLARPPSTAYRIQKAIRRHKLGFAAGAAVCLALLIGVTLSTTQAVRATRAEHAKQELLDS